MDYLEIAGFRSLRNCRVALQPINILIGANGSGKSNFITFFDFLNVLSNRLLNEYVALKGGADRLFFNGIKETSELKFKMEFNGGKNGYAATIRYGADQLVFMDERLIDQGDQGVNIQAFVANKQESYLQKTDNFRAKYVINYLEGLRRYHFHDTSSKSPFTRLSHVDNEIHYLTRDGGDLAAFLYHIAQSKPLIYRRILQTVRSIAPYFQDFLLRPNAEGYVRLTWREKFSDTPYGPTDFSDGTLRFIALTVLFLQPDLPATIIIDEPELGLHPAAVAKLAGMVHSAAARGGQVILATQSADLLAHFTPEDVVTVDRAEDGSQFRRLNSKDLTQWLNDYGLDDLWRQNIISYGQPNRA